MKISHAFILLIALVSCTASQKDQLLGEWFFSKVMKGNEVFVSDDKAEQAKILDKAVAADYERMLEMNMTKENYRKFLKEDMELMLKVSFTFQKDSTVVISANNAKNKQPDQKWNYTINEERKLLTILEGEQTVNYRFEIKEDQLSLIDGTDKLVFKRKSD